MKENKRDDDHANYGPEVEQLGRKDSCISIGQDCEIVTLNVHERENNVFPAVYKEDSEVLLEAVAIDGICRVDEEEKNVIEESLKGGNVRSNIGKKSGEGISSSNAKSQDLSTIGLKSASTHAIDTLRPEREHTLELSQSRSPSS